MASENANKVLSYIQRIFNTGPYGDPPLKIKISKIGLRLALSWAKLGLEPKFHDPGTFGGFGKREHTNRQDSCFINIDLCSTQPIQELRVFIIQSNAFSVNKVIILNRCGQEYTYFL